jgi:GT2 family glycosyltransferase
LNYRYNTKWGFTLEYPFISIVVGVKNEEKYIRECIESLLNIDYPTDCYEIFIVDGMSNDDTQNIIKQYPLKLILNEKKNVAAARNLGVKIAKGNLIAFTDGDCKVDRIWLKTLVKEILNAPDNVACVGGPNLIFDTDSIFARVVGYSQETLMGSGGSAQSYLHTKKQYVQSIPNCNALYKKSAIEDVGYFDEYFVVGQDGELNYRMQMAGFRFLYVPEAKVWHHRRATLKSFSIWMFKYGEWIKELFRKHRKFVRWYAPIPPIAIIFSIVAVVTSLKYILTIYFLTFFIIIYFSICFISALQVLNKMKSVYGLVTLIVLPIQHISYGLGIFYSIIKKKSDKSELQKIV